jgi:hypothetical protein
MALSVPTLAAHLATGGLERGVSQLDGGIANYNIYETKDGKYLTVGALEDHFWKKFCDHVGAQNLISSSPARGLHPSLPTSSNPSHLSSLSLISRVEQPTNVRNSQFVSFQNSPRVG